MEFYFPLYHDLKTKLTSTELSQIKQDELLALLKENKDDENIYLLMRSYENEQSTMNPNVLPFEGKQLKSSVRFDLDKIPMELKCMFLIYFSLKNKKDTL